MNHATRPDRSGLALALLFLALFSIAACGSATDGEEEGGEANTELTSDTEAGEDADGEESEEDTPKRRERATTVVAAAVERGELVLPIVAEGTIRARNEAEVRFEIGGRIARILVEEGQRVRRGQRLALLDDREYQVAKEEAHTRYLEALGRLAVEDEGIQGDAAEAERIREQQAALEAQARRGEITEEERRLKEIELGVAGVRGGAYRRELLEVRSGLATARADEARAALNLERTVLVAPFAGVVSGVTLDAGEWVQAGTTFCTVTDDVDIEAEVGVLESDLGALEVGRPALLEVPALGRTIPVQVDVVSPSIDTESRTCTVLLRLRSEDGRVKPGMFVRASIAGQMVPDQILVPREAILTRDGRPLVFKVEEDRSKWLYVTLGPRNDNLVAIERVLQGGPLEPGDEVVVDNHLTLTHDAKIRVKETRTLSDPWAQVIAQGN